MRSGQHDGADAGSSHAAYVRQNDLYLENLRTHEIKALTTSDSADRINGTFDWVYEEEFHLRDGFAWSPDGREIAYWQIDTEGVLEFTMIDNTAGLYPRTIRFKYPKAGERNPACRVGVVDIRDAKTRWLDVPGNRRNHYIARMEWAADSRQILLQQLNRLQNINRVMLADARDGGVRTILKERDDAWVDVHDELEWLSGGKRFTWLSERDGWRHVYLVSHSGKQVKPATPGDNVDGYQKGSPIHFAHQLEGNLLVIHGTGDDNVHYQSTEALADELIRHNRPFTMMAYPNRTHAIREEMSCGASAPEGR